MFVPQGPHGVESLTSQDRLYSRMKRDAAQAESEKNDRKAYQKLALEIDPDGNLPVVNDEMAFVRGPSMHSDFFT